MATLHKNLPSAELHQPFAHGLDADKSATPVLNDWYYATDTKILYKCDVAGSWVVFPDVTSSPTLVGLTLTGLTISQPIVTNTLQALVSLAYTGATSFRKNLGLETTDSPAFAGLTLGTLSGLLKATTGVIGAGSATCDDLADGTTYKRTHNDFTDTYKGYLNQSVQSGASPTFAGLVIGSLAGVLKAASGTVSGSATCDDIADGSTYVRLTSTKNGYLTQNVSTGASPSFAGLSVGGADTAYLFLVHGVTKGVRIGVNATGGLVEGVDNTGIGSYQPLMLGGSNISFTVSNVEKMTIAASTGLVTLVNNLMLGNTTPAGSTTPRNIDLGGTYSTVAGNYPKLIVYDDGAGNIYGLGVSSTQFDYMAPTSASHVWYNNAVEFMRLASTGMLTIPGNLPITWGAGAISTGMLTVGKPGLGLGSAFFHINTSNADYCSGLAIDGSYNAGTYLSTINLTAYGVKAGGGFASNLVLSTTTGTGIIEGLRVLADGTVNLPVGLSIASLAGFLFGTAGAVSALAGSARFKVATVQKDISSVANFAVTGVGFTPSAVILIGVIPNQANLSIGFVDAGRAGESIYTQAAATFGANTSAGVIASPTAVDLTIIDVVSYDSGGVTFSNTHAGGVPTGTVTFYVLCIR